MINQIMHECNNYFPRSSEYGTYVIAPLSASSTVTGTFADDYLVGQYIYVKGSVLNDGVYKISAVGSGVVTVSTVLQAETTIDPIWIFGLKVPNDFLSLVTEITSWQADNSGKDGIASESIGRYSVSFQNGGAWQNVFASKLNMFRCMYDATEGAHIHCRNWQNR
jgi:hypothetical protein